MCVRGMCTYVVVDNHIQYPVVVIILFVLEIIFY